MNRAERRADRLVILLDTTARDLLRYLERRLGPDDAHDALSETMTILWRRAASLPASDEDARLWAFGIARNVVLNTTRSRRRQQLLAQRLQATIEPQNTAHQASDTNLDVRAALEHLAPELDEIVRLVHWDGFTLSEAARIVGTPVSTTRDRYQRAKRELSERLAPRSARSADVR